MMIEVFPVVLRSGRAGRQKTRREASMLATTKTLTCSILAISFCSFVVLSQQTQPGSQSNQRTSAAEVAEEAQLNASLVELYKAGKFDEALPVARRLLELREKMFGPEDPVVGIALSNLAEIFRAKKRSEERRVGKECRSRWS